MALAALEMEPSEEEDFRPLVAKRNNNNNNNNNNRTSNGNNGNDSFDKKDRRRTVPFMLSLSLSSNRLSMMTPKRIAMVLAVTFVVLMFVLRMDFTVTTVDTVRTSNVVIKKQRNPHTGSSFGGLNNVAQPAGAKAAAASITTSSSSSLSMDDDQTDDGYYFASLYQDIVIPKSNVGHAIPSLNAHNVLNLWGHYVHDEFRSPYASHLYDKPKEELERQQTLHEQKMEQIRTEWGMWKFQDPAGEDDAEERPVADFSNVDYKDLPAIDFPPYSWQADEEYVTAFLQEARALVTRMTEGIYAEYGWPFKKKDGTTLSQQELEQREQAFRIHILDPQENEKELKKEGIAQLSTVAMDGLVRKLLHAMMTNDHFFVVLAGHSAAAGHGNDFQQNRVITFHRIMEPVFDKLGMTLISRNMGMGGVGTLQFTLGGGDFYGEADILEWDSGMTEKGPAVDFFNKQAILSGERVPVIFNEYHFNVMAETNGTAWMGKSIWDLSMMPETTLENQNSIPFAARWMDQKEEKYNAVCWEARTDFSPEKKQSDHPGSQVGWHPGFRHHQWSGRKLALVVLKALSIALDRWEEGTQEGHPLPDTYWHVGESYKLIRNNLRTHITTTQEGNDVRSECEKLIKWLPRICRVQMHGFGLWTPQAHEDTSLLNIVQPALNGYKPYFQTRNIYDGFDLLPYKQAIPEGEIDVHAIAIATNTPAPDLDHSWMEDGDSDENSNDDKTTRRLLREGSEMAFRAAALAQESIDVPNTLPRQNRLRKLADNADSENAVVPGRGWELHGWSVVDGFCDGSAQSECKREKDSDCLMYGASDNHMDLHGNSLSGWLVFNVPKVREGIILARMEWWCGSQTANSLTKDWTEVDDGKTMDTTPWDAAKQSSDPQGRHRILKKPTHDELVPSDFEMDIAINGKIVKTMKRQEWLDHTQEFVKNVAVFPLLNDESMAQRDWEGEPVEAAIRFRSKKMPKQTYCISHIYYA
ncbi:hypothetical protein IV203_015798 [Nitzschia inconspicua]|uniref:Uncharacterized protein n=1 Tax=Nitzschia inconspicua TaxID=303405 RepID=A0A9K3LBG2_9STRA|nr:hypothetical protein IV203_015798 [Nitzschia inconspicua]